MAQLLLDDDYIRKHLPIGDNTDLKPLTSDIEWIQDAFIRPLLGQDLYELILAQSLAATLTAPNLELLNDHILKVMRFYLMSEAIRSLKYRYTNVGVMISTSANGTPIPEAEMESLIDKWSTRAERYGQMMQDFIYDNQGDYPTFWTQNGVYRERPRLNAYDSPLSFGSTSRKRWYYTEIDKRFDNMDRH